MAGTLTIDGLASGLDTQSIIEKLVALELRPVAALTSSKTTLETQQTAWKDINSRLLSLQSRAEALQKTTAFNSTKANSSDTNALTVTSSNTAVTGTYHVSVTRMATAQSSWSEVHSGTLSSALGLSGQLGLADGSGAVKSTLTISSTDSLLNVKEKINATTATTGISASIVQVDTGSYRLVLSGTKTGVSFGVNWTGGGVLDGLTVAAQAAQKADFTVNGMHIVSESNIVTDAIPGVTMNLLKGPADSGTPLDVTVTVNKDVDGTIATIKSLVDQYNSLATFISSRQTWDKEKKVGGILLGDASANGILRDSRRQFMDVVPGRSSGQLASLAEIGITSGAFGSDNYGKLVVDETKLRQKLTDDPDQVMALFTDDGGIAKRLVAYTKGYTDPYSGIIPRKDKEMASQLHDMADRIEVMNDRVEMVRDRYTAQFQALETALGKLKNQQSWLTSQLDSLS
jgi:flagellar hook-associated protein 2